MLSELQPVRMPPQVTKESRKAAVDDQFGGESDAGKVRHQFSSLFKSQNAYMLVYIQETEWDEIMCSVAEEDVALHLRERVRVRSQAVVSGACGSACAHGFPTCS